MLVFPGTGYLEIAWAATRHTFGEKSSCILKNFAILEALLLSHDKDTTLQIAISPPVDNIASFQILSLHDEGKTEWRLHATGEIEIQEENSAPVHINLLDLQAQFSEELKPAPYYQQMSNSGIEYGESFRGIRAIWRDGRSTLGHIELPSTYIEESKENISCIPHCWIPVFNCWVCPSLILIRQMKKGRYMPPWALGATPSIAKDAVSFGVKPRFRMSNPIPPPLRKNSEWSAAII